MNNSYYYGINHTFTTRSGSEIITLQTGVGESLELNGSISESAMTSNRACGGFYVNSTAETTLLQNTFTKIAGTTTADEHLQKFTHSNNKLTYTGTKTALFLISYNLSITGTNNNAMVSTIYKNGDTIQPCMNVNSTIDSGGKISYTGSTGHIELSTDDFIELFIKNTSAGNPITAQNMTMNILGPF